MLTSPPPPPPEPFTLGLRTTDGHSPPFAAREHMTPPILNGGGVMRFPRLRRTWRDAIACANPNVNRSRSTIRATKTEEQAPGQATHADWEDRGDMDSGKMGFPRDEPPRPA